MKQSCLINAQEHENEYSFTRQLINSSLVTHLRMKQSCLTSTQENENVWIPSQSLNNQALLIFSF
jgi:hypothetical protein